MKSRKSEENVNSFFFLFKKKHIVIFIFYKYIFIQKSNQACFLCYHRKSHSLSNMKFLAYVPPVSFFPFTLHNEWQPLCCSHIHLTLHHSFAFAFSEEICSYLLIFYQMYFIYNKCFNLITSHNCISMIITPIVCIKHSSKHITAS